MTCLVGELREADIFSRTCRLGARPQNEIRRTCCNNECGAGKRPGAFCAYTVPSHHPYVFLNWTSKRNDVLTLAHELGHGLHGHLAREQGVFHQSTPLTLAETASVFGETVTFGRLLSATTDPQDRLALLAESI